MKQLTFTPIDDSDFDKMGKVLLADPCFQNASSCLQIVFAPARDCRHVFECLHAAQSLPNTTTVGLTTFGPIMDNIHVPENVVCSFLIFEHSDVRVDVFDCNHVTPQEAGLQLCDRLDGYKDVKGILCVTSKVSLVLQPFVDELARRHGDIPFFGTHAANYFISSGDAMFFVDDQMYECGIMAVSFCGEDLHIKPNYNLGWRPIGNDHVITSCEQNGLVHTIDGVPAVSIYQHYLKVALDENFFVNVCSFPLVVPSGEHLMARVPVAFTEDGSMRFLISFDRGSHAYLSYAHPDDLMRESMVAANELNEFAPDGLILFACINRRVFLGDEGADRELRFYSHVCPQMAWGYGGGEIMRTYGGGGLLNSTIVAFALREGSPGSDVPRPLEVSQTNADGGMTPLSERLATFLEATTNELNQTIRELESLAKRDPLTGAVNRRRIDEVLHYELSKRRKKSDLVLLMYDIDFFKDVNDTYGHDVGDVVLTDLTRCVQSCIREGDTLGRWGGEEFVCLLTDLSIDQARVVAERIRTRVEEAVFFRVEHITISIGITAVRVGDTPEVFFQRVDQALYDAKHAGRNCVRVR